MPRRDFTKVPFAATGDATSIPTAVQPDGSVSMTTGYGFDYQRDNGAGGGAPDPLAKSIPRDATNGILNEITASIGEIQLNGLAIWAASAAPYPINATVRHNNTNWRSTVENNSAQPGVAPLANWFDTTEKIAQATESVAGIAKIATSALALAGTDNATIMTPAKTKAVIAQAAPGAATESASGIARIATAQQALEGTDNATIITPLKLKNRLDAVVAYWERFASNGFVVFSTPGVFSWTVPELLQLGYVRPKVTVIGGGGGNQGGIGGTSSFGDFCQATGGGASSGTTVGLAGFATGGDINVPGGNGGTANPSAGSSGGGSFFGVSGPGPSNTGIYGCGAPGEIGHAGAAAGGTAIKQVNLTGIATVSVTVGAPGTNRGRPLPGGGIVIIEW